HVSTFTAGSGFLATGVAQIAQQVPSLAYSARLVSLSNWGGRIGVAEVTLAEGFVVAQYWNGDLTRREFLHSQARLGGGIVGSTGGGFVGFKVGAFGGGVIGGFFGPGGFAVGAAVGGTVGGCGGGIGGGVAGAYLGRVGVERLFQFQDAQ